MASGGGGGSAAIATPTVASGIRIDPNATAEGAAKARALAASMPAGSHLQMMTQRMADQGEAQIKAKAATNAGTAAKKSDPIPAPVVDPGTAALPTTGAGTATVTDTQPALADVPADPWGLSDPARKRSTIGSMGAAAGGTLGSTKQPLG